MDHITEPSMLVLCSDVIELIEAWEKGQRNFSCKCSPRFSEHYKKATKNLRKFNRRTLSN